MKRVLRLVCFGLIVLLFTGCSNQQENKETKVNNKPQQTLKQDDFEYKRNIVNVLKSLNDRIDFDYNEALVKHNFEFLAFNVDDLNKAENTFNETKQKYSQIKNSANEDLNKNIDALLSKYEEVIKGRHLVLEHKNDTKFLSKGYSQNVVAPINDIKKIKEDLNLTLLK